MNAMRDLWSDERLDDLNHRVDEGFKRNEREFQAVRLEMRTEFQAVRADLGGQIAALQRSVVVMMATMLIGFVTVIATVLTQT
ncbi:MAG TPA: hypothetical protein VK889_04930 [Solirubrobacterales bacterium]|nr:hypothetical protein [Solirubrobacterales bacterium]